MKLRIPSNLDGATTAFVKDLFKELDQMFGARTPDAQVRSELFLASPDKSVWQINVANDGTLSATKVKS